MMRELYLWACERLYHELAPGYEAISGLVSMGAWGRWRRLALAHALAPALASGRAAAGGLRLLEIGFGTGALLAEGAAMGVAVTGLELSAAMHAVALRRRVTAPRVQAAAQAMPFAAAAFDCVLATFPAPYILQPETLAECRRVLDGGGRLVIGGLWVQLAHPWLRALPPVFYADPTPAQIDALSAQVARAGFAVTWEWADAGWAEVPILVGVRG